MWEESCLVRKISVLGLRQIDTKLLWNQCELVKTLFQQRYQDTHCFPVYESPFEERDHLSLCPDPEANKVFSSGIDEIKVTLEEKNT